MNPAIVRKMQRDITGTVRNRRLNVADIIISWQKPVTGSSPQDPALEGTAPATTTVTDTQPAFVHFVEPVKSFARQFTQIATGDVILDFLGEVDLPKQGATFIVKGERYVQKDAGKELTEFWDMLIEGERHVRTVVASRSPGS